MSAQKKITKKPWGHELLWAQTKNYVGKFLHIKPGHRLSLQYHETKEETIHVSSGNLIVWLSDDDNDCITLRAGSSYHVEPNQIHRFGAPEGQCYETVLIEVSTNYLEDVVRLADDYRRDA